MREGGRGGREGGEGGRAGREGGETEGRVVEREGVDDSMCHKVIWQAMVFVKFVGMF